MKSKTVHVAVPASSGNLGVGFDVLGLALELRNEVALKRAGGSALTIRIWGEGESTLPTDSRNVVGKAIRHVFRLARRPLPGLDVVCGNRIPLARGLGSSAAAVLGGLMAANKFLGDPFDADRILGFATAFEGHPDNVAPALFGGIQASGVFGKAVVSAPWPVPRGLRVVVAVPSFHLSTKKARSVLPNRVPLADAVANLAAVALLPEALARRPDWLKSILNDRLHEPYRARLIPGFSAVKKAALRAKAFGVTLSGAGPTMLAFVPAGRERRVGEAMRRAFAAARVESTVFPVRIAKKGAQFK